MLGKRFQQAEVVATERILDMAYNFRVIQCILDIVSLAGAGGRKGDFHIQLQGLRYPFFPFIYANKCFDLEFAQKNNIHTKDGLS